MSSKTFHFAFGSYGIIHESEKLLVIKKMVVHILIVMIYLVEV